MSGKILLRDLSPPGTDWDDPLPSSYQANWEEWRRSLQSLQGLTFPRMYVPTSLDLVDHTEVLVFSDVSEKATAAAAYLRVIDSTGSSHVGFIMGKSKLAPPKGPTIPRLELCGAVLATEVAEIVLEHLDIVFTTVRYYTDSKVGLGYISTYTYVSNRVDSIHKVLRPEQWNFVPTHLNPADCGTRCSISAFNLKASPWLHGPSWLSNEEAEDLQQRGFPLITPDDDREIRPCVDVWKTASEITLGTQRFQKFSSWKILVEAMSVLQYMAQSFAAPTVSCPGWHKCSKAKSINSRQAAELFIMKEVRESFSQEIECLTVGRELPRNSPIRALSPVLDNDDLLRVGGRLNKVKGSLPTQEINPLILPKAHYVSQLLIHHCHESVKHQGRYFTEGALRSSGYWISGANRMIASLIRKCVTWRKLRGNLLHQKMADLRIDSHQVPHLHLLV